MIDPSIINDELTRALRGGLVGLHVELYHNSPVFKIYIDSLVERLPMLVADLAQRVAIEDVEYKKRLDLLMRETLTPIVITPDELREKFKNGDLNG